MRKMVKGKNQTNKTPLYFSQYQSSLVEDYKEFEMDKIADK